MINSTADSFHITLLICICKMYTYVEVYWPSVSLPRLSFERIRDISTCERSLKLLLLQQLTAKSLRHASIERMVTYFTKGSLESP